jgi:predicted GNAT family acetyltransferase
MSGFVEALVEVTDNAAAHRWEVRVDGELAGLAEYRVEGDRVTFPHTEVYPRFEGQGLAGRMVGAALAAAVADGRRIVPRCSFVADYVQRHPEYAEHVAG